MFAFTLSTLQSFGRRIDSCGARTKCQLTNVLVDLTVANWFRAGETQPQSNAKKAIPDKEAILDVDA